MVTTEDIKLIVGVFGKIAENVELTEAEAKVLKKLDLYLEMDKIKNELLELSK